MSYWLSSLQIKLNGFHVDVSSGFNKRYSWILLHAACNTMQNGGQATGYNEEGSLPAEDLKPQQRIVQANITFVSNEAKMKLLHHNCYEWNMINKTTRSTYFCSSLLHCYDIYFLIAWKSCQTLSSWTWFRVLALSSSSRFDLYSAKILQRVGAALQE